MANERRGENDAVRIETDVGAMLEAGLTVVVVEGDEIAGVTAIVDVVVDDVGEGITTPFGGSDTTPRDDVSVGPCGWLRGTKTSPKIPARTKARETAHQMNCVGRFPFRDFTSPI